MIAHSAVEVATAADRLATGTLADFSRAMGALASGDLDAASARVDLVPVMAISRDEVGAMARSFNTLQEQIARAAVGLVGAREGLRAARHDLREMNATLERRVVDRTAELEAAHRTLVVAARRAGMAEVAVGVLHNVGNVLNSVNVSASLVDKRVRDSKVSNLDRIVDLIAAHRADLGRFITDDERGRLLPDYLTSLAAHLQTERKDVLQEIGSLTKNIDHIGQIVSSQQSLARGASLIEDLDPIVVMDDALQIHATTLGHHDVTVTRQYARVPTISADKHQILQILVNLVSNAARALEGTDPSARVIVATVIPGGAGDRVIWRVRDNGVGIRADHLNRIFEHGFTTKANGHGGLGLHTAALAATLMSGSLRAESQGLGTGATFSLELPIDVPRSETLLRAEGAIV
jgi:C4-dicarboxylate-specific signal transduction histidine kinase